MFLVISILIYVLLILFTDQRQYLKRTVVNYFTVI